MRPGEAATESAQTETFSPFRYRAGKGAFIQRINQWRAFFTKKLRTYAFLSQYISKKFASSFKKGLPVLKKLYAHNFPAMHFKLDGWQYLCNFSSEILVTGLVMIVSIFSLTKLQFLADNSLLFAFLSHHTDQNKKLAERYSTIDTVVASSGLFSAAYADTTTDSLTTTDPLSDSVNSEANENDYSLTTSDSGMTTMVRPNPDSIASLVAKQFKIYKTTRMDFTVYPVAAKFGISPQTIMWANDLNSVALEENWDLLIPPVNGVAVIADSNTTIPDLANTYGSTVEKIVAYNALADAEDIDKGQIVMIPGGTMPPPAAKPATPSSSKQASGARAVPRATIKGKHAFPYGYCTWYVATKVDVPNGGNAGNWKKNAEALGIPTGNTPRVGSVVVTTESRYYGHVAYVEKVFDDGSFEVSEMNYEKFAKVNFRKIPARSKVIKGFIYY